MKMIPLYNVPMMDDEDWNRGARENAVHNYIKVFGCEPSSVDAAVEWQRKYVEENFDCNKKAPLIRQDARGTTLYF